MNDTLVNIFYSASSLFSLVLIGLLWRLAYRYPQARRYWGWLAVGWTVNALSSLIWGAFVALASEDIPDLIDILYVLRYVFVLLAVWLYPAAWPMRRWLEILAAMLVGALVLWFSFYLPLRAISDQSQSYILAGAIFPLLDVGMVYACLARWRSASEAPLRTVFGLFMLSSLCYGVANWANYWARAINPDANAFIPLLFWLLTDVFAFAAAVYFARKVQKVAGQE